MVSAIARRKVQTSFIQPLTAASVAEGQYWILSMCRMACAAALVHAFTSLRPNDSISSVTLSQSMAAASRRRSAAACSGSRNRGPSRTGWEGRGRSVCSRGPRRACVHCRPSPRARRGRSERIPFARSAAVCAAERQLPHSRFSRRNRPEIADFRGFPSRARRFDRRGSRLSDDLRIWRPWAAAGAGSGGPKRRGPRSAAVALEYSAAQVLAKGGCEELRAELQGLRRAIARAAVGIGLFAGSLELLLEWLL